VTPKSRCAEADLASTAKACRAILPSREQRRQSVGQFYEGWQTYNERIVEVVRDLSAEQLWRPD